jgi:hypothetical protein
MTAAAQEEEKKSPEDIAKEEEQKKKDKEDTEKRLNDCKILSGDYQIQVHIIEARELKGENLDGTSDPIVYVECFGQKQHTATMWGQCTCVFDELLLFNVKGLDKEAFEEGIIRVTVRDCNSVPGMKNTMIGAYAFDATSVYFEKDHEYYRK